MSKKLRNNLVWLHLQTKKPMPPNPAGYVIMEAFTNFLQKFLGRNGKHWRFVYRNGEFKAYGLKNALNETISAAHKKMKKNPALANKVRVIFEKKAEKFLQLANYIAGLDPNKLTNVELYSWYKKYFQGYLDTYPYGEPLAWILKDAVAEDLERYLGKRAGLGRAKDILQTLITPRELSFISEEEYRLSKIALAFKQNGNAFSPAIKKTLQRHVRNFSWIPYDYGVMLWTTEDFKKRVRELARQDLAAKLTQFKNYSKRTAKEQQKLFRDLGVNSKNQKMFFALQTLTYLNDYKKEVFSRSHVLVRGLQDEMAKRIGLNWNLFGFMSLKELQLALQGKPIVSKADIKKRFQQSIFEGMPKKEPWFTVGRKADEIISELEPDRMEEVVPVQEVHGQVASRGIVQGKVKVLLSPQESSLIKKGNILVAIMTSPDYVIAMKKAAAIVTDEGGMTSHAAIVSRELRIPCVTGTKIATKVFKDGDLVEVDADNGVVRILK